MISVIITTYNSEKFIETALRSVSKQTYKDFECLIVDDCSTDGTLSLVKDYIKNDNRFRVIALNNNNKAPATPRNIGIDFAKHEFVAFLDPDDFWVKEKLEYQLFLMNQYPAVDIVSSERAMRKEFDNIYSETDISDETHETVLINSKEIDERNHINLSSTLIRKNLFKEFEFNPNLKFKAVEDYLLWYEYIKTKRKYILKSKRVLYYYSVHEANISNNKLNMLRGVFRVKYLYNESNLFSFLFNFFVSSVKWYFKKDKLIK